MRVLSFLFFLILMVSCQDVERTPRPDNLISEDKMVEVLTELSLLQGARSYNKSLLEETGVRPRDYLWEKYNIDSLQFMKSNNYYAENYRQYQRIYQRVKLRLESYKQRYDSLREQEELRGLDSLRVREERDTVQDPQRIFRPGRDDEASPTDLQPLDTAGGRLGRGATMIPGDTIVP